MSGTGCRNCDAVLAGRWCHACGQDSRDPVREFPLLAAEVFDALAGWDSRLGRSLRSLFARPGELALEFLAGRRARYLGPVRLYLIASLVFFALYTLVMDPVLVTIIGAGDPQIGVERLAYVDRWLPTMMIVVFPCFALALHLLFRGAGRPFIATQVLALNFGTVAFLNIPVGHLAAFALLSLGAGPVALLPIYAAHGANAVYLFLMARRFYGLGVGDTLLKFTGFVAAMTLVLMVAATLVARLIEASR